MASFKTYKKACEEAFEIIRSYITPKDTGNLAYNALQYRWEGTTFHMYVDENIAPYMVFTNEFWAHKFIRMGNFKPGETVERFRTWDNPNEGWWDRACEFMMNYIAGTYGVKPVKEQ